LITLLLLIIINIEAVLFVRKGSIEPWYPWGFKLEPTLSKYSTDLENINDLNVAISSLICPQPKYASYYLDRGLQDKSDCTTFSLCNNTFCIYFGPAAVAFGLKFSTTRGNKAEMRMHTSFSQHPTIIRLMGMTGLGMGFHHRDENAVPRFLSHISDEMHLTLLKELTKEERPLSFIKDTATDEQGNDILAVKMQTLDPAGNGFP
jgi:hypothetical protein